MAIVIILLVPTEERYICNRLNWKWSKVRVQYTKLFYLNC